MSLFNWMIDISQESKISEQQEEIDRLKAKVDIVEQWVRYFDNIIKAGEMMSDKGYQIGTQEAHDAFVAKRQANCPHTDVIKEQHLTGEGAMEYVEWYDNYCPVCGKRWTTND